MIDVPSETALATFPGDVYSAEIAGAGQVLGRVLADRREVSTLGGTVLWSEAAIHSTDPNDSTGRFARDSAVRLSPDGTRIAVADRERHVETRTHLYKNGSLTAVVRSWPVGWLDDQRLLVNRYDERATGSAPAYSGAVIVSTAGQVLSSTALPEITQLQRVGSEGIYSRERNAIFSMPAGTVTWSISRPVLGQDHAALSANRGAVAGDRVVFVSGATVRAVQR